MHAILFCGIGRRIAITLAIQERRSEIQYLRMQNQLHRKICNNASIIQFKDHIRTIHTHYCSRNKVDVPKSKWPSMSTKFQLLSLTSVQVQLKVDVNTSQVYDSS